MQYLKEEIRERIVVSAKKNFLESGYVNTSMRKIANDAGIVSGNIYRYYKNKEALFKSVVHPIIITFNQLETKIKPEIIELCEAKDDENLNNAVTRVSQYLYDLFKDNYVELLLTIDCSDGTSCAGYGKRLQSLISEAIHTIYDNHNITLCDEEFDFVLRLVITSYTSCLHFILREDYEDSELLYKKVRAIDKLIFKRLNNYIVS